MSEVLSSPEHRLTKQVIVLLEDRSKYRATVKSCTTTNDSAPLDVVVLDFEIVGLCQYPIYDINKIEPIKLIIAEDTIPYVLLEREDFPAVPHMNVSEDNHFRSMCYVDQTYEEIKQKLNGGFLLECINNWFVKTARNELHRVDQPMEPFFLGAKDVIILEMLYSGHTFDFLRERNIDGIHVLEQMPDRASSAECFAVCFLKMNPEYSNILHRIPKTLFELSELFLEQNITKSIRDFANAVLSVKRNQNEYMHLFKQSLNSLLACKILIVMDIPLSRSRVKTEVTDYRFFVTEGVFQNLLSDFGYIKKVSGQRNKKTSFEYQQEKDNQGKNIKLTMYAPHLSPSVRIAQIMNNSDGAEYNQLQIVQIGAGALGSKILELGVRSGMGKWTVVDNDRFWPHNLMRHTLLRNDIGEYKSVAVANRAKKIIPDVSCEAVADDLFSGTEQAFVALSKAELIIDTSASIGVERFLALDIGVEARNVSLFLNPSGTATIMLLENQEKSIRLDLLEMQYYKELLSQPVFEKHLQNPETVSYSVSCRDVSSKISSDNLSLAAALGMKALKELIVKPDAMIALWIHTGFEISSFLFPAESWISFSTEPWTIYISLNVLGQLYKQRSESLPNETGGILVGCADCARNIMYIVHQVDSPSDSISSPTSYIRGCKNLEADIAQIKAVTRDNLYYIGEWHSHPAKDVTQSSDDNILAKAIAAYNQDHCRPSCMVIIGDADNIGIYICG